MRPTWKGAISFGMVTIPVKLYPATESKDVRLRMLCPRHLAPIQEKRVCSEGGEELEWKELTRGVEVGKDEYVELEPDEIDAAKPESSTTIEIGDFVEAQAIDPIYFEKSYFLELLRSGGVALCLHDMEGSAPEPVPLGPCVYVRFHGAGRRYGGRYPDEAIAAWAERMTRWSLDGRSVWAYFNNDAEGHAVTDALRLREAIARQVPPGERLPAERHANCIGPPT